MENQFTNLLQHLEALSIKGIQELESGGKKILWSTGDEMIFENYQVRGLEFEEYCVRAVKYKYVDEDHPFMRAADQCRIESGCYKQQTGAVIVKNDEIVSTGANIGELQTWCEREKLGCKTGEGYEHCRNICKQFHHCERTAIFNALQKGIDLRGCDLYLSGHWYICVQCWKWCLEVGIKDIVLDLGAVEKFTKPISLFVR